MQQSLNRENKPKKVIINNLKRSIMGGGGINNSGVQPITAPNMIESSSFHNHPGNSIQTNSNEINKLNQQIILLKQKNDQSLIKVRFLCDKLESFGGLSSVPQNIINEVSETDLKIKKLQQLLYFRRSKQISKLKKKIKKFIELIDFDIAEQDLNKLQDEVEIIFFLIDIFSQKYNHIMSQKTQIDQIVDALKQDTVFNRQQLQQQNKYLKDKQSQHIHYIRDLELQVFNLKKQATNLLRNPSNIQLLMRNQSNYSAGGSSNNTKILQQTIKSLQNQNENYISKIFKLENSIKNNEYQIINYKRRIEDYQNILSKQRAKYRQMQEQLHKVQRQELRWKQRYQLMEKQKNQRIQLLQKQKIIIQNSNISNNFLRDEPEPYKSKKLPKIFINKINRNYDNRYENEYDKNIDQQSGEQYFDLEGQ